MCWKAHRTTEPHSPLVIKDSWQFPEREDEGAILQDIADRGVANMARYYHHYTVHVDGKPDDILNNVRKGIDLSTADFYKSIAPEQSDSSRSLQRASNAAVPSGNWSRPHSRMHSPKKDSMSSNDAESTMPLNRIHRRIVLRDYGKLISYASSLKALLRAFDGCIIGHKTLYDAGYLHRDISIGNLMINEDEGNHTTFSFLIDCDMAIKVDRVSASGTIAITGTLAFMAVGALRGEQHSYLHDLESFFCVLFWICVHFRTIQLQKDR